jgi:hypothetical protein
MGKSRSSEKRMEEAFAMMDMVHAESDAQLAEFAAEVRRATKSAHARKRLMAHFKRLVLALHVEREEAAQMWFGSESYEASRRAGDRAFADHRAGKSKDAHLRAKRDKAIKKFIRQQHSEGVWGKRLVEDKLVKGWGIKAKDGKPSEVEKGYALSTDTLRKIESRIRHENKKAPGRE